ncbi:MAG: FHA domain-containing protein [Prochloraceae cyanobacterium]
MIICTNCNHQNPEGSVQCENCYAPLPKTSPCPNCGAFTQINAVFCGQCGYNLLSEKPLSFGESDLKSENFSESKNTIPPTAENFELPNPWDSDPGEQQNTPLTPIAELDAELAPSKEFTLDSHPEQDIFEPDLEPDIDIDLDAELPEMSDIDELEVTTARSVAEIAETSEPSPTEAIDEPAEDLEEFADFAFDANAEQDILGLDLALDIEAELPEMSDIDELEATTARSVAEISPLEEPEVTNPELELVAEISAIAEPTPPEELEVTNPELELAAELPAIAKPTPIEELEVTNPELELAAELPAIAEPTPPEELEVTNPELAAESLAIAEPTPIEELEVTNPELATPEEPAPLVTSKIVASSSSRALSQPLKPVSESATQLQLERIILSHVQTGTDIELAQNLDIIRIGKPNSQIPPDIDVSVFPDANIVSRVHANIRVEGHNYFIEDAGSSNGTYINHKPLLIGNRHRLRFGDRISFGKGDLMTFIFKIIEE